MHPNLYSSFNTRNSEHGIAKQTKMTDIAMQFTTKFTWSKVCCAKSVVDIITPATKEPNSRLKPSLSLLCGI